MLKKTFMTMVFIMMIVVGTSSHQAEAREVYMGVYSDGTAAYLLTHTIEILHRHPYAFHCDVYSAGSYIHYNFFSYNGSPFYRNSWGYEGYVYGGQSPVAANIHSYVVNRW